MNEHTKIILQKSNINAEVLYWTDLNSYTSPTEAKKDLDFFRNRPSESKYRVITRTVTEEEICNL